MAYIQLTKKEKKKSQHPLLCTSLPLRRGKKAAGKPSWFSHPPPSSSSLTAGPVHFLFTLHRLHHMSNLSHQHTCSNYNLAISIKTLYENTDCRNRRVLVHYFSQYQICFRYYNKSLSFHQQSSEYQFKDIIHMTARNSVYLCTSSFTQWLFNLSSASRQHPPRLQFIKTDRWMWGGAECVTRVRKPDCQMWDCDGCRADCSWRRLNVWLLMRVGSMMTAVSPGNATCLPACWLVISPPTATWMPGWKVCLGCYKMKEKTVLSIL